MQRDDVRIFTFEIRRSCGTGVETNQQSEILLFDIGRHLFSIWKVIPFGSRTASEIACVPPMAAIANAIFNATGVRIKTLPLNPENVLRGLKEAGKA